MDDACAISANTSSVSLSTLDNFDMIMGLENFLPLHAMKEIK